MYKRPFVGGTKKKTKFDQQENDQSEPILLQASLLFEHEANGPQHSKGENRPQISQNERTVSTLPDRFVQELQGQSESNMRGSMFLSLFCRVVCVQG
jgi:hypothetical protein